MTRASFERGAKIERLERNLANPETVLKQIGALMVSYSQDAFTEQGYDDERWPPRRVPNVMGIIADFHAGKKVPPQRRLETRPALRDTGRLSNSIAFRVVGDAVEVGSNVEYAGLHHHGGETESKPVTKKVQDALAEWLQGKGSAYRDRLQFLLSEKMTGKTLEGSVPARPFLGITKQLREDVLELIGEKLLEVA